MKAIIAHPNLDFDALASMAAAQKLYPDAVLVTIGKLRTGVKDFIAMHGDFIEIRNYINKKEIDTLIMVDTRSAGRLNGYGAVLENDGLKVIVYDHHEDGGDDVSGAELHFEPLGANVTQLVERIRERGLPVSAQEATMYALGIYDDTGSLLFPSTTVRDMLAAAWLLEQGASLPVISEYTSAALSGEQSELFQLLLHRSRVVSAEQRDVLFAAAETDHFVSDLSVLTMKLKETFAVDAVFAVVRMDKRVYIVGRSSLKEISVRDILAPYGGRGHRLAASAMLKEEQRSVEEIVSEIESSLPNYIAPSLRVKDIMSSPVKTISADITVNEVGEYLVRYGHSGYPVVENGKLIGIITHRDIEKCKYHGLGNVPVKGYMSSHVVTAAPDMTVSEVRRLMVERNVGRLPVVDKGELVGIVSRTDLLELLYGTEIRGEHRTTFIPRAGGEHIVSLSEGLKKFLPEKMFSALRSVALLADEENISAFLVGGLVRDLLMGRRSVDLDIVVEGDGIAFAEKVGAALAGKVSSYPKFGTATVTVNGVVKIDIAGARTEFYEYPAAKPQIEESSLKQDLFRRDFTINAMALSLNYASFCQLIDYYNGRDDIAGKTIRVLHNLSFVEDPTRIVRALRFAARYGFHLSDETEEFARSAVADGVPARLSRLRLWHEIRLSLEESCAYTILASLDEYGVWPFLFPDYPFDTHWEEEFALLAEWKGFFGELARKPDLSLVRCLLILSPMEKDELDLFFEEVQMPRHVRSAVSMLRTAFDLYDGADDDMTELQWYRLMENAPVEVIIAAYIKSAPLWRKRILRAFRFYREHRVFCEKKEIRALKGYERGMMNGILTDLLEAKKEGKAETKEEELRWIEAYLKQSAERD